MLLTAGRWVHQPDPVPPDGLLSFYGQNSPGDQSFKLLDLKENVNYCARLKGSVDYQREWLNLCGQLGGNHGCVEGSRSVL